MTDASTTSFSARTNRSQRTITVDNFMRKALRVSDPHNPDQIANALLARYPEEADRDRREREGLAYSSVRDGGTLVALAVSAGSVELETARADLERDLATITTLSQLKDIAIEMTGWGRAIRAAAADGLASARLALDSVNHDTALSARRTLSEYARLARFVGALSDGSGLYFRKLAQSCDVLGALILVAIGDGLAASGITRSTAMVRVAAGELQSRRNAVIGALRNLIGSVDTDLSQEDYPRGVIGYQTLIRNLESGGQADLRALLEENALAGAMDQLVDLTTGSSVAGLRELSTTAALLTHRFVRLVQYGQAIPVPIPAPGSGYGMPESPPLLVFVAKLQLFVDAFATSGSSRLLYVARPPVLAYGLYSTSDNVPANRLVRLTIARGNLVTAIDCLAGCGCDIRGVQCIVMFDFVLAMVDRAIDLLAVGTDPNGLGEAEQRAAAAALLALHAVDFAQGGLGTGVLCDLGADIPAAVDAVKAELLQPFVTGGVMESTSAGVAGRELQVAYNAELQTETLVRNLAAGCANSQIFKPNLGVGDERAETLVRLLIRRTFADIAPSGKIALRTGINIPQTVARSAAGGIWGDPYFEQH
ncbi:hypothetical protein [Sphingomonas sp. ERG5]|uniref:hypothetical protein n=1 Tax=Sphingomonas sp. ERG5 TaxID=1381597 RepID=UPI00068C58CF|nr:hypothetical protein [Sphingomonas sp. ERG5]